MAQILKVQDVGCHLIWLDFPLELFYLNHKYARLDESFN